MEEKEFLRRVEEALRAIDACLDERIDAGEDIDYETLPGEMREITCANGRKIIINRHMAVREIWLATHSQGFHFAWREGKDGKGDWIDTRDSGQSLQSVFLQALESR